MTDRKKVFGRSLVGGDYCPDTFRVEYKNVLYGRGENEVFNYGIGYLACPLRLYKKDAEIHGVDPSEYKVEVHYGYAGGHLFFSSTKLPLTYIFRGFDEDIPTEYDAEYDCYPEEVTK